MRIVTRLAKQSRGRVAGFSLLEVLIAIVVLSIGVLTVAGLQVFALRANQVSYQRSQAAVLAAEIIDRMRANRAAAAAGNYSLDPDEPPPAPEGACEEAACNGAAMAARDLSLWFQRLVDTLPGATAEIVCSDAPCTPASLHTVTVMWDEDRTGAEDTSCPPQDEFDAEVHLTCLVVSAQP